MKGLNIQLRTKHLKQAKVGMHWPWRREKRHSWVEGKARLISSYVDGMRWWHITTTAGHSNQWYVVWLNNPLIFIGIESFATVQCWSISRSYFNLGRSHNVLFYSWGRAEPIWSLFKGNWLYGGGQEGGYHIFQLVNESSGLS